MQTFAQDLGLELVLTIAGNPFTVPGGHVKNFAVTLYSYGFTASVDFWLLKEYDLLFSEFVKQDLITVNFVIKAYFDQPDTPPALTLQGLVQQKRLREIVLPDVKQEPVLCRHYSLTFSDVAQVLWGQHFPCQLAVDSTMKNVIEAHKGEKITLNYDFAPLDTQKAIIMVGLGDTANEASFYDFVIWYIAHHNGLWLYDSVANSYKIATAKQDVGVAQPVVMRQIKEWQLLFPETTRHEVQLLNHYTENIQKKTIANTQAVTGVRRDMLLRYPIAGDLDARGMLETARLQLRQHELHLSFSDFPTMLIAPGCLLQLDSEWGVSLFPATKVYRVWRTSVVGHAHDQQAISDMEMAFSGYDVAVDVALELQAEKVVQYPPFRVPHYPVCVEGKMLSETGQQSDETYQIYQESATSLDVYKVAIPLWDNTQVIVPFAPYQFSHHFYFPLFKNSRVLVAFELHSAIIRDVLDWRSGARLPVDGQGNHILFGWSAESQTSMRHTYSEQKAAFSVKRKQAADTELLEMKEGTIVLETKEEQGS
jgi:hypothetical protein